MSHALLRVERKHLYSARLTAFCRAFVELLLNTAGSVFDLHALLPPEFSADGSIAYDIDTAGNIVGLAQRPDGSTVGVLWRRTSVTPTPTPIPTPTPTPIPTPTPTPTPTNIAPSV
jgi:hypothetical protein